MIASTRLASLERLARRAARRLAPGLGARMRARILRRRCEAASSLEAMVDLVLGHPVFFAVQRRREIEGLLDLVRRAAPRRICEIGSFNGGTACLFAQVADPGAHLLCIDRAFTRRRQRAMSAFARRGQRLTSLKADSHAPETAERVRRWLGDERLDFLFIDGDHSLPGLARDMALYAPLVRDGGLIALHDIVPDFATRFGIPTASDVGQAPAFWADLKRRGHVTQELIEDPDEDGMGIGVIHWRARDAVRA